MADDLIDEFRHRCYRRKKEYPPMVMRHRHEAGPRRATSVDSYIRQTRVMAGIAFIALVAGIVSDDTSGGFWARHSLLAGLVASVIVVMLSVAVLNEAIERRQRQRWSVLAQYVMFELVRNARMIWSGILDVAGLLPTEMDRPGSVEAGAPMVRDTSRLTAAVRESVGNVDRRRCWRDEMEFLAEHSDAVLGRWAGVMLNAQVYAEILDRHVELAGDVAWVAGLFDASGPPDDLRRQRARSSPATQIGTEGGPDWLADRIVVIAQLAEDLDRGTLELALKLVPVEWWHSRLGTTPPANTSQVSSQ